MNHQIRKNFCRLLLILPLALFIQNVSAQDMGGMIDQYKSMSKDAEKNFPKALEALMPKGYSIKTKGFVFKETTDMFMLVALTGNRVNDVYKKGFCLDSDIEISVFAYNVANPATYMMKDQMPLMLESKKKAYKEGLINESNWEKDPVQVFTMDKAYVFMQKGVRKKVELPDFKHEDQVYYFAKALMLYKTALVEVSIIYYPAKAEGAKHAISHVIKTCLNTNLEKYMK